MAKQARTLVASYIEHFCPIVKIASWDQLAGEYAIAAAKPWPHSLAESSALATREAGTHHIIVKLNMDLN